MGATAVGKTSMAIRLAQHFQTEIISADSRQFFRELNIGTAKPNSTELSQAKHHFINSHSIFESYNAGKFEQDAILLLNKLFAEKDLLIMVGGSGMYVDAVCKGMDEMPEIDLEIREKLNQELEEKGLDFLVQELQNLDPDYANQVEISNPQRVIRALEVCRSTGKAFSSFRNQQVKKRDFEIVKIALDLPRPILYQRIDDRMDKMLSEGLLSEAKSFYANKNLNALQTVGYKEIYDFLDKKQTWEETVFLLKRNSRRYAKRQLTWFRKDRQTHWVLATDFEEILELCMKKN